MSKTLIIKAHPLSGHEYSKSSTATHEFAMQIEKNGEEIELLDLFKTDWSDIDEDVYTAFGHLMQGGDFNELNDVQKEKLAGRQKLLEQFMSADKYVFSFPMWELSFPSVIKKYLDTIVAAPHTFGYSKEDGVPYGKLENKKSLIITSGGSDWQDGSDYQNRMADRNSKWGNYGRDLLMANLEFIGITDNQYAIVDKTNTPNQPADTNETVARVKKELEEIAKSW